jgi:hypothetical protein
MREVILPWAEFKYRPSGRLHVGRDSSVDVTTYYGMEGLEIETRWGAIFSAPVQTGPRAHPGSCAMGTRTFPGVRRPESVVNHPPLSSAFMAGLGWPLPLPGWPNNQNVLIEASHLFFPQLQVIMASQKINSVNIGGIRVKTWKPGPPWYVNIWNANPRHSVDLYYTFPLTYIL